MTILLIIHIIFAVDSFDVIWIKIVLHQFGTIIYRTFYSYFYSDIFTLSDYLCFVVGGVSLSFPESLKIEKKGEK